jgi:selenophosphate synthase
MPMVDDPRDFGRIAAADAISDIYAMGGRPLMALAILGMPLDKLPVETVREILNGGASICAEAGIPVAGGGLHFSGFAGPPHPSGGSENAVSFTALRLASATAA